jgi:hypothetical protein
MRRCCRPKQAGGCKVVAPYLIPVSTENGEITPLRYREVPRAWVSASRIAGRPDAAAALERAMYRCDSYDHALVNERVAQFRDQANRRSPARSATTSSSRCG